MPAPTDTSITGPAFNDVPAPCILVGDPDRAEQLLLSSSRPTAAIEVRRQLGHWDRAIELAEELEPHAVGSLSLLRAQALEADGQVGIPEGLLLSPYEQ